MLIKAKHVQELIAVGIAISPKFLIWRFILSIWILCITAAM